MARHEISAGLLAYRRNPHIEVLLGHPGGPFWQRKDEGAWTIPKGLVEPGSDLVSTAQREFLEETGLNVTGTLVPLAPAKQKSGKIVHAFAVEANLDLSRFVSNTFALEWPPRSGKMQTFPEIDRLAYFSVAAALRKIIAYQRPFLDELTDKLRRNL